MVKMSFYKLGVLFEKWKWTRKHRKLIRSHYKAIKNPRKLTKEQKKEARDFWKDMTGLKIQLYNHEGFYSRTGHFTKEYVPTDVYHLEILPRANMFSRQATLGDKNMCDLLFPGENIAHSFLKNINGYYYYEGRPVSIEEAVKLCANMENAVIKPSLASKGNGVKLVSAKDGVTNVDGLTVEQLFKKYKRNFLIQDWIHQHKDMAALNPTSVNTIRVLSYRSGMEVLIIYSVIRIGRSGSVIDNQCAGGISTAIDKQGRLFASAFGGYSANDIRTTDTGITLEGYQIPSYDKVIEFVQRLHLRLPFFDIVGWDVAVQEDGNPVLIEFNTNPGLSQSAFGSGMGDYTERIVREVWPRPNSRFRM